MSFWNSPAAAQLFKFWPDSPNLECQVHGLATANLQLNREDRLFYNNWTSKRTSLLNYMFQLIWNIHAVPTFERHGAVRKPEYLSTRLLVFCHEEIGGTAAAEALIVFFS
jgi:hypothetical protein